MQRFPVINASGSRIAFSVYEGNGKRSVYVFTQGGASEKMCEGCLRATDWSQDEKTLLIFGGSPYQINILNVASHQQTALLKHPTWNLLYGRFSPDNRWVSFTARIQPNRAHIMIAPIDGPKPVPERAWIESRKAPVKTGQTGRQMERRFISRPQGMDISAYGDSGSKQAPIVRWASPSPCSIFTVAFPISKEVGPLRGGELPWC